MIKLLIRILCSLALLTATVYFVSSRDILAALAGISPLLFLLAVVLQLAARWAVAVRARVVASSQGAAASTATMFRILLTTQFYGLFMPGILAAGGVTWWKYVERGIAKDAAVAILVLNRAVGMWVAAALGGAAWLWDQGGPWAGLSSVPALMSLALLLPRRPGRIERLDGQPPGGSPWSARSLNWHARQRVDMFLHLPLPARLTLLLSSITHELVSAAGLWMFALALGIEIGLVSVVWIRAALQLLLMVPVSLAGIGLRELGLVGMGSLVGVMPADAFAWGVASFAGLVLLGATGGLLEVARLPTGWRPVPPANRP